MSRYCSQTSIIDLKCGELHLQLAPDLGGSIFGFWWNNTPLLRPTQPTAEGITTARQTASFPLIPFSNRIANASFEFLGEHYVLPRDPYEQRHALHGNAFCAAWQVEQHTAAHARLSLEYHTARRDIPYFPFSYTAWQDFSLHERGLAIEMKIQNCDTKPMPAGMGHHFYFPLNKSTKLQFNSAKYWESDDNLLPLRPSTSFSEIFSAGEYVSHQVLDNCFEGWSNTAKISNKPEGYELDIECSTELSYAVLYIPKGKDYFAFEPVTHLNNAINIAGPHGIKYLKPGEIWSVQLNLIFIPQEKI